MLGGVVCIMSSIFLCRITFKSISIFLLSASLQEKQSKLRKPVLFVHMTTILLHYGIPFLLIEWIQPPERINGHYLFSVSDFPDFFQDVQ